MKLACGNLEANAQGYYAQDAGFFQKAGLDVEITILRSGPAVAAAIVGGDAQVGVSNVISLASAKLRGIPLSIIAPGGIFDYKDATEEVVVLRDGPIHVGEGSQRAKSSAGNRSARPHSLRCWRGSTRTAATRAR